MDQTGSARSYPTSTTARCGKERKARGPEKECRPERLNARTRCREKWAAATDLPAVPQVVSLRRHGRWA
eukprot:364398-Chlamydomonas_euryale.AAC.18